MEQMVGFRNQRPQLCKQPEAEARIADDLLRVIMKAQGQGVTASYHCAGRPVRTQVLDAGVLDLSTAQAVPRRAQVRARFLFTDE